MTSAARVAQKKLELGFSQYIRNFVLETRDSSASIAISNRMGMLINGADIGKMLEEKETAKDRFKAIVESITEDEKGPSDKKPSDTKVINMRVSKTLLK